MPRVNLTEIKLWRSKNVAAFWAALVDNAKCEPIKNQTTTRWHAAAHGYKFELQLIGPQFFDTLAEKG